MAQTVKNLPAMQETWDGKMPWRRAWQPTPVFLPGESHGQRSLMGYSPRGGKELDTAEWLTLAIHLCFFWPHHSACRILVPQPGMEPRPSAVRVQSSNHWTAWEFPPTAYFK